MTYSLYLLSCKYFVLNAVNHLLQDQTGLETIKIAPNENI